MILGLNDMGVLSLHYGVSAGWSQTSPPIISSKLVYSENNFITVAKKRKVVNRLLFSFQVTGGKFNP